LDALRTGSKSNQDDFVPHLLPVLKQAMTGNARLKVAPTLMVHMDNSMCHDGAKITEKMSLKGLGRASHPAYSRNISPCDFWAF
jgi:hypothetical protein